MKNIFCIGLGKLGLTFSYILAESGYRIYGNDINQNIRTSIDENITDSEPKLNYLIKKYKKKFTFTNNFDEAIKNTSSCFLILPTPSKKNHEFDNSYIYSSLNKIGKFLRKKRKYLINVTSTVNPGSCNQFIKFLEKKFKIKHGKEFILTYNPHLIALGSIYNDVTNSDLVIAGSDLPEGHTLLKIIYKKIYKNLDRIKLLNLKEAEISKISVNSYITMKISFSNLISSISDRIENINSAKILNTLGFDKRIGHKYLSLGAMYAGPCFPRDNLNFAKFLKKNKLNNKLPKIIDSINNIQFKRYIEISKKYIDPETVIGICGLSYKDNTPITTKSPGQKILDYFCKKNKVNIYDNYIQNFKSTDNVKYIRNLKIFFRNSDVIFICYRNNKFLKMNKFTTARKKIIFDIWNIIFNKNKKITIKKIGIS